MKIPAVGSMREAIVLYVLKNGKCPREQIVEMFSHTSRSTITETLYRLVHKSFVLSVDGDVYSVPARVAKHYAQSGDEPHYVGELVPPRTATPFKPLKALPWERHMDKIRTDISFKNGGTLFTYGWAV